MHTRLNRERKHRDWRLVLPWLDAYNNRGIVHIFFSQKIGALLTTKQRLFDTEHHQQPERAYLVAVETDDQENIWSGEDSIAELRTLAHTAGATVIGTMLQHLPHPNVSTYIGKGRLQELSDLAKQLEVDLFIFDDELSPTQQRNLENILSARVIDRTALILDVFAQHARSREGRLQVELAQLEYRLPHLQGLGTELSRQAGGSRSAGVRGTGGAIGVRGPGETKLEIDRRRIRSRVAELNELIEEVRQQRAIHRQQRVTSAIPVIAIVGYTNAGKSTLFNALTESDVLAEDKLFATLDPITRHLFLPGNLEVLMTDTVGFIQKLPTKLIAAFRATLEEIAEADILLEVVDIHHPMAIEQSETVNETLIELQALDKPRVTALNKIDLLIDPSTIDTSLYPNAIPVSAFTGTGLQELRTQIAKVLVDTMETVHVKIPFARGELVELFHRRGHIEQKKHGADGIFITGRLPRLLHGYYRTFLCSPETE